MTNPIWTTTGQNAHRRSVDIGNPFSLHKSVGPVAWGKGRWPNVHWCDDRFHWVGRSGATVVWRSVQQTGGTRLEVAGTADPGSDLDWLADVLGIGRTVPAFADPVVSALAVDHADLRPFADGGLWEGLLSAIAGQGVTVSSGATMLARVAALHHCGVDLGGRTLWPLPTADELAADDVATLRTTGLTRQRCATLIGVARLWIERPDLWDADADPREQDRHLLAMPGVGPWSVAAARLWGLAEPDAHPSGDVALLRAARLAYGEPGLTLRDLDRLAERWRPNRAWAARLLWHQLFGGATPAAPATG